MERANRVLLLMVLSLAAPQLVSGQVPVKVPPQVPARVPDKVTPPMPKSTADEVDVRRSDHHLEFVQLDITSADSVWVDDQATAIPKGGVIVVSPGEHTFRVAGYDPETTFVVQSTTANKPSKITFRKRP